MRAISSSKWKSTQSHCFVLALMIATAVFGTESSCYAGRRFPNLFGFFTFGAAVVSFTTIPPTSSMAVVTTQAQYRSEIHDLLSIEPKFQQIQELSNEKLGINRHFRALGPNEDFYFIKAVTQQDADNMNRIANQDLSSFAFPRITSTLIAKNEEQASRIAHFLTDGLVPQGTAILTSPNPLISYSWVELNRTQTQNVFGTSYPFTQPVDVMPFLLQHQKEQLFVHMVASLLIDDRDTHPGQFGINLDGDLISFDKGFSFLNTIFKARSQIRFAQVDFSSIESSKVFGPFIEHLKLDPILLNQLFQSSRVQELFARAENTHLDEIANLFPSMTDSLEASRNEFDSAHWLFDMQVRFHNIRNQVEKYFQIPH